MDAAGRFAKVRGGVAGRGMMKGRAKLEETMLRKRMKKLSSTVTALSIEEAKALAREILLLDSPGKESKINSTSFDSPRSDNRTSKEQLYMSGSGTSSSSSSADIEIFVLKDALLSNSD